MKNEAPMTIEHHVLTVDDLRVDVYRHKDLVASGSRVGAFYTNRVFRMPRALVYNACHEQCEAHATCLAIRAHQRMKESGR